MNIHILRTTQTRAGRFLKFPNPGWIHVMRTGMLLPVKTILNTTLKLATESQLQENEWNTNNYCRKLQTRPAKRKVATIDIVE